MPESIDARVARSAVFRLDAGRATGWGHLARSGALASALRARGWICRLWTSEVPEGVPPDLVEPFGDRIPAGEGWIGQPPSSVTEADWIVIDHHGLDDEGLHRLRRALSEAAGHSRPPRLLVFDDEGRRTLASADLVLNSRPGLEASPYATGVPALLGERHALLRPGLLAPEAIASPFPRSVDPVLVMLGGTDPLNLTGRVLEALADVDPGRFAPVLVRAKSCPEAAFIRSALTRFAANIWLESVSARALAGWARHCRYAVSAAGGTLHELALLRLPFVAVVAAENQRAFAMQAHRVWGMPVVEGDERVRESVAHAFGELLKLQPGHGWTTVDGHGAERVAIAMETAG
jgi:UDP-2,4-diacetamido-2,4,6-trideoxy-beta-L-altropyranose hydrolase